MQPDPIRPDDVAEAIVTVLEGNLTRFEAIAADDPASIASAASAHGYGRALADVRDAIANVPEVTP